MQNRITLFLGVLSIFLGGMIYIIWRSENLLMFSWFNFINIDEAIQLLRNLHIKSSLTMPEWFYFSLPNALWTFGGILLFKYIWKKVSSELFFWITLFSIVSIGSELGQYAGIIPGTFDINDVSLTFIFIIIAMILINKNQLVESKNDTNA